VLVAIGISRYPHLNKIWSFWGKKKEIDMAMEILEKVGL